MANDNGNDKLRKVLQEILESMTPPASTVPDDAAREALRRDAGLMRENESMMSFIKRVRETLRQMGALAGGDEVFAAGGSVRNAAQRKIAGLGLSLEDIDHERAADAILGTRGGSGIRVRRPPTADDLVAEAGAKIDRAIASADEEELANVLLGRTGGAARPRRLGRTGGAAWLAADGFRPRIQELRTQLFSDAAGRLADLSARAAVVLGELLDADAAGIRLAAARCILEQGPKIRESTDLSREVEELRAEVQRLRHERQHPATRNGTAEATAAGPGAAGDAPAAAGVDPPGPGGHPGDGGDACRPVAGPRAQGQGGAGADAVW
jgi:hypothetical protein